MTNSGCVFCQIQDRQIILSTPNFLAFHDIYPVTEKHTLIIPRRHVAKLRDLTPNERHELTEFIVTTQNELQIADKQIAGFNIGINEGAAGGQTVFHLHVHVIPRRAGDMIDPRGGVRGVIPDKQKY
jgi:diadenosine tetraphosphate (Ap4A) HIT family hydrolase